MEEIFNKYKKNLSPTKKQKRLTWKRIVNNVKNKSKKDKFFWFKVKPVFRILSIVLVAVIIVGSFTLPNMISNQIETLTSEKVDDWQYNPAQSKYTIVEVVDNRGIFPVVLAFSSIILNCLYFIVFLLKVLRIVFFRYKNNRYKLSLSKLEKYLAFITFANALLFILIFLNAINLETGLIINLFVSIVFVGLPFLAVFIANTGKYVIKKIKSIDTKQISKNVLLGIVGILQGGLAPVLTVVAGFSVLSNSGFFYSKNNYGGGGISSISAPSRSTMSPAADSAISSETADESIGYSTGGAKDANNFRENIRNGYLPLPTDITYEGVFYDYYFNRGQKQKCEDLFCPSYSKAVSKDPISNEAEYYMTVGLNSNIKESDFKRKKLNLVIVLDISGSMGSSFNKYYYDQYGNKNSVSQEDMTSKSKMQIANEAVVKLTKHLNENDRFSMVLFNGRSHLAKPLNLLKETDMESIRKHILQIKPGGSTNMEAGYEEATKQLEDFVDIDKSEYENRIIFLTDMQPNTGQTNENMLFDMTNRNAKKGIYTTFIGVGVDFNTQLVEYISKVKGANYYSVHSSKEFYSRMDEQFEYMVTPLVFDLKLKVVSDGFKIKNVYGSPQADKSTGEILEVNTLFPSKTKGGETKGGIVLLELEKLNSRKSEIELIASYTDRNGETFSSTKNTTFDTTRDEEYYENTGIQKAIVLSNYVTLTQNWINDERNNLAQNETQSANVSKERGIIQPNEYELGKWERESTELEVSSEYKSIYSKFLEYFSKQKKLLEDDSLNQEEEIINTIIEY